MSALEGQLNQLFKVTKATFRETYVGSDLGDQRFLVKGEDEFETDIIKNDELNIEWLKNEEILGPYEKRFLHEILDSENQLLAYRGGSGCGKSSLVAAIEDRCKSKCLQKWSKQTGLSTFTSVVDFQPERKFSVEGTFILPVTPDLKSEFFGRFVNRIMTHVLAELIIDDNIDHFRSFFINSTVQSPYLFIFRQKAEKILGNIEAQSEIDCKSTFTSLLNEFDPEDQVAITVLFLVHLGNIVNSIRNENEHLILVFDNTDRLMTEYLNLLLTNLRALSADRAFIAGNLKIVVFMRLSTSRDTIAALDHPEYLPISSPDPEKIVIPRILSIILSKTLDKEVSSTSPINNLESRLIEFMIRFYDPYDKIDELLLSIAGTNLRSYFIQLTKLLSSAQFYPRIVTGADLKAAKSDLTVYAEDILSFGLMDRFSSILFWELRNNSGKIVNRIPQITTSIVKLCISVCEKMFSEEPDRSNGTYSFTSPIFKNVLQSKVKNTNNIDDLFSNEIFEQRLEKSIFEVYELIHEQDWSGSNKEKTIELFLRIMKRTIKKEIEFGDNVDSVTINAMSLFYSILQKYTTKEMLEKMERWRVGTLFAQIGVTQPIRKYRLPKPIQNRYQVSQMILSNTRVDRSIDYRPLNVFSLDEKNYCPVPLEVISILAYRSAVREKGSIQEEFNIKKLKGIICAHGIDEEDFYDSVALMFRQDNRLIYSTVADLQKVKEAGFQSFQLSHAIYLSWTGWRYFKYLINNLSYLQWTLFRVGDVVDRLNLDVTGLAGVGVHDGAPDLHSGEDLPEAEEIKRALERPSLYASLDNLQKILVSRADWRLENRISFFPGETGMADQDRQLYHQHTLPELNILMRVLPDICGVLDYQFKRPGAFPSTRKRIGKLKSDFIDEADRLCAEAESICSCDLEAWRNQILISKKQRNS